MKEFQIIIQFSVPINFEPSFLGKSFPLNIKEFEGVIEFPNIYNKDVLIVEEIDLPENLVWGKKISNYLGINALLIRLSLDENSLIEFKNNNGYKIVENWVNIFKKHIEISSSQILKPYPEVDYTILYGGESAPRIRVSEIHFFKLSNFKFLLDLCKNLEDPPIELELINEARTELDFQNYRKSIIDGATAIEITLSKICERKLIEIGNSAFSNNLLNNKYRTLGNRLHLAFLLNILQDDSYHMDIVDIRNKIIHKGYKPTHKEAKKAFYKCQKIVEMFSGFEYFN